MANPWWVTTKYNFDPEQGSSQSYYDANTGRQVTQDASGRWVYSDTPATYDAAGTRQAGAPEYANYGAAPQAQVLGNGTVRLPNGSVVYASALQGDAGDYSRIFGGMVDGKGYAQAPGVEYKPNVVQGSDGQMYAAYQPRAQIMAPRPDNSGFGSLFMRDFAPIAAAALPFTGVGNALTGALGNFGGKVATGALQSTLTSGNPLTGAITGGLPGAAPMINNLAAGTQPTGATMDWTSGYDLPMGNTPVDASGWTSGYDLPMGDTGSAPAGWTSGYDLPMGGGAASTGGVTSGTDWIARLLGNPGLPGAAVAGAGALLGANTIGNAAERAAAQSAAAADRATALQAQIYADQVQRQEPWRQAGVNALAQYVQGSQPGGAYVRPFSMADFNADPGYGFRFSEGMKGLQNSAAARGGLLSGNTLKGITNYGQGAASQEYQNAYNRYVQDQATQRNTLANIAGYGPAANSSLNTSGTNYANTAGNLGVNAANTGANAGLIAANAQASAYGGIGSAIGNALSPNPFYTAIARQFGGT